MFVSVRRVPPKLPQIKELIMPFMTEVINEEETNEKQVFEDIMGNSFHADKKEGKILNINQVDQSINSSQLKNPFKY